MASRSTSPLPMQSIAYTPPPQTYSTPAHPSLIPTVPYEEPARQQVNMFASNALTSLAPPRMTGSITYPEPTVPPPVEMPQPAAYATMEQTTQPYTVNVTPQQSFQPQVFSPPFSSGPSSMIGGLSNSIVNLSNSRMGPTLPLTMTGTTGTGMQTTPSMLPRTVDAPSEQGVLTYGAPSAVTPGMTVQPSEQGVLTYGAPSAVTAGMTVSTPMPVSSPMALSHAMALPPAVTLPPALTQSRKFVTLPDEAFSQVMTYAATPARSTDSSPLITYAAPPAMVDPPEDIAEVSLGSALYEALPLVMATPVTSPAPHPPPEIVQACSMPYEAPPVVMATPVTPPAPLPPAVVARVINVDKDPDFKNQVMAAISQGESSVTISTEMALGILGGETAKTGSTNKPPLRIARGQKRGACG